MSTSNDTVVIPLTQGQQTVVSAIDADLAKMQWYAIKNNTYAGKSYSAYTRQRDPITNKRHIIRMNRLILQRILGRDLQYGELCDHIDRNPLNNTRGNLRLANKAENNRNTGKHKQNKSGFKGVHKTPYNKWVASIQVDNRGIYLGVFDTPEEAHATYCEAAKKYHGEFFNPG